MIIFYTLVVIPIGKEKKIKDKISKRKKNVQNNTENCKSKSAGC